MIIFYEASGHADYPMGVLYTPEMHTPAAWALIPLPSSGFERGGI